MKKFFFLHPDIILTAIAIVLLGILLGFFSWGINDVISEIHQSSLSPSLQGSQGFDLQKASQLQFNTSTAVTPTPPIVTSTATSSLRTATSSSLIH